MRGAKLSPKERAIINLLARHYHTLPLEDVRAFAAKIGMDPNKAETVLKKAVMTGEGIREVFRFEGKTLVYL